MTKPFETEDKVEQTPEDEKIPDHQTSEEWHADTGTSAEDVEVVEAQEIPLEEEKPLSEIGEISAAEFEERLKLAEEQNLRLRAEFANFKKRIERDQIDFATYLKGEIMKEFLPILDDFKAMLESSEKNENDVSVLQGAKIIYDKFLALLQKQGVQKIEALGSEFDPNIHEALMMQPTESEEQHNKVLQVFQDGFKINEKLIRPTKVIVGQYSE